MVILQECLKGNLILCTLSDNDILHGCIRNWVGTQSEPLADARHLIPGHLESPHKHPGAQARDTGLCGTPTHPTELHDGDIDRQYICNELHRQAGRNWFITPLPGSSQAIDVVSST